MSSCPVSVCDGLGLGAAMFDDVRLVPVGVTWDLFINMRTCCRAWWAVAVGGAPRSAVAGAPTVRFLDTG